MPTRNRKVLSNQRGMGLIEITVAAVILGGLVYGFMNFMKMANRGQSNLQKMGEAAGIDMAFRTLLTNNKGCVTNASHLTLGGTTTVGPVAGKLYDASDQIIFEENKITNGIQFVSLKTTVSPVDRGVHSVRYDVKLQKMGETLGKSSYDYTYFTNVILDSSNAPVSCYQAPPGDPVYQMIKSEDAVFSVPSGTGYTIDCNGVTSMGPGNHIPMTCPDCNTSLASCAQTTVATMSTVAKGNYLRLKLRGNCGLISRGNSVAPAAGAPPLDHSFTPADNINVTAIGNRSYMHLTGPGVDEVIGFGNYSRSTEYLGHTSTAVAFNDKLYPVTAGQTYSIQFVLTAGNGTAGVKFMASCIVPDGSIEHWNMIANP